VDYDNVSNTDTYRTGGGKRVLSVVYNADSAFSMAHTMFNTCVSDTIARYQPDPVTGIASLNYTYDSFGRLKTRARGAGGAPYIYAYDTRSRLIGTQASAGAGAPPLLPRTYTYDGNGAWVGTCDSAFSS